MSNKFNKKVLHQMIQNQNSQLRKKLRILSRYRQKYYKLNPKKNASNDNEIAELKSTKISQSIREIREIENSIRFFINQFEAKYGSYSEYQRTTVGYKILRFLELNEPTCINNEKLDLITKEEMLKDDPFDLKSPFATEFVTMSIVILLLYLGTAWILFRVYDIDIHNKIINYYTGETKQTVWSYVRSFLIISNIGIVMSNILSILLKSPESMDSFEIVLLNRKLFKLHEKKKVYAIKNKTFSKGYTIKKTKEKIEILKNDFEEVYGSFENYINFGITKSSNQIRLSKNLSKVKTNDLSLFINKPKETLTLDEKPKEMYPFLDFFTVSIGIVMFYFIINTFILHSLLDIDIYSLIESHVNETLSSILIYIRNFFFVVTGIFGIFLLTISITDSDRNGARDSFDEIKNKNIKLLTLSRNLKELQENQMDFEMKSNINKLKSTIKYDHEKIKKLIVSFEDEYGSYENYLNFEIINTQRKKLEEKLKKKEIPFTIRFIEKLAEIIEKLRDTISDLGVLATLFRLSLILFFATSFTFILMEELFDINLFNTIVDEYTSETESTILGYIQGASLIYMILYGILMIFKDTDFSPGWDEWF